MLSEGSSTINGLHFKLMFFDFAYMLGEFLQGLSELHVKIQLVERYCNKVLHNLKLLEKQGADHEAIRQVIRRENRELVAGLEHHAVFYDKYQLRLLLITHAGTEGELIVEEAGGDAQYVVPLKQVIDKLMTHMSDTTPIQEMGLFAAEQAVLQLMSAFDEKAGETARKVCLELEGAARQVHVYVKKEKVAEVKYLAARRLATDPQIIALAEAQEPDKEKFLKDPLVRQLFLRAEVTRS